MLCHVALVRTDISEERSNSNIRVTRIGELGATLVVTSNRHKLWRATQRNIPEDGIPQSQLPWRPQILIICFCPQLPLA
jgi:hypothetical protein